MSLVSCVNDEVANPAEQEMQKKLMALYCPSEWWNGGYTMVGTWYSNGDVITGGNGHDAGYYSWQFRHNFASIGHTGVNTIRSVRDWYP